MSFEFSPYKLVYGGEALGHAKGRAVLVPRALPGERLEVEPVRVAKGVVHARPLRVLEAAPERIDPPCRYFGRCGGRALDDSHPLPPGGPAAGDAAVVPLPDRADTLVRRNAGSPARRAR